MLWIGALPLRRLRQQLRESLQDIGNAVIRQVIGRKTGILLGQMT
jgi:hypothetical protein